MEVKRAPHPARLDGNGIEYLRNKDRNCMSRRTMIVVARIVCLLPVDGGAADDDGVFVAVAERAWHFLEQAFDKVLRVNGCDSDSGGASFAVA